MKKNLDRVLVGRALVGQGDEIANIKLLLGPRGSAAETAFCHRLVATGAGSEALLVSLSPELSCKPHTLLVNHNAFVRPSQTVLLYGPAQAAVAQAVTRFALNSNITPEDLDDLYLTVSLFIHPDACDSNRVFLQNRDAVSKGLHDIFEPDAANRSSDELAALGAKLASLSTDTY